MSGLGKGVVTSSIAKLLQLSGQSVSCAKIDPYLNYDAGTMNPVAHGEVFVTEDGGECDMDIGNYERFLNLNIPKSHNITTAQVYSAVIGAERRGDYLGACVQIIPHVTDEIKSRIRRIASDESLDMLVVECGGTVGDIESLPFLEALRQMRAEEGHGGVVFVHVTLAPSLDVVGEQKTKPTQHSVQELRRIGIQPDYLAVRSTAPLGAGTKKKISMFTNVAPDDVLSCHDARSIFQVPGMLHAQGIVSSLLTKFGKVGLVDMSAHWDEWNAIADAAAASASASASGGAGPRRPPVRIAMVGKYVTLADSYVSVNQALAHAGAAAGEPVSIDWLDSEAVDPLGTGTGLEGYHGILVPGGFGTRGADGIIAAAGRARTAGVPYLGICFGFQLAAVSFARSAMGLGGANTTEIDPGASDPVVDLLPGRGGGDMGGSLRLGASGIRLAAGSAAARMYGASEITRRHRHRYELNNRYRRRFEEAGMVFTGEAAAADGTPMMEVLEVPSHPFFVGVQFHPEFSSRPGHPEPVFSAFVRAAAERARACAAAPAAAGAATGEAAAGDAAPRPAGPSAAPAGTAAAAAAAAP